MSVDSTQMVIFVGPPQRVEATTWADRRVICTTTGVLPALERGLLPEAVFALPETLDPAIRSRLRREGTRLVHPFRETALADLETALNYAITTGARDVLLLGMWSDDPALALARVMLLARPEWGGARVWFVHGKHVGHVLRHGEGATMHGEIGSRVTLVPLSAVVTEVTGQGLVPALRYEELALGETRVLHLSEEEARVWIGAGRLLVVHTAR